ncbi:hypothetical protein CAQUA_10780 [Corynebacterium aquatimens]|uniref:Uncharacterized protein n=1 Tax=Corynebacterium aquatimens TaxID=1190508 RepID=A0A931E5J9_9CORY|nr:hypothetical protein [Corynebacterium aquatimens]WJY66842.1 hypothetical protein CAQUA_10780 [Corynebacterium aquatimens]
MSSSKDKGSTAMDWLRFAGRAHSGPRGYESNDTPTFPLFIREGGGVVVLGRSCIKLTSQLFISHGGK